MHSDSSSSSPAPFLSQLHDLCIFTSALSLDFVPCLPSLRLLVLGLRVLPSVSKLELLLRRPLPLPDSGGGGERTAADPRDEAKSGQVAATRTTHAAMTATRHQADGVHMRVAALLPCFIRFATLLQAQDGA
jgi:hypothetical protein